MSENKKDAMEIIDILRNMQSYEQVLDDDLNARRAEEPKLFEERERVEREIKELNRKILRLESRKNHLNCAIEDNRQKIQRT